MLKQILDQLLNHTEEDSMEVDLKTLGNNDVRRLLKQQRRELMQRSKDKLSIGKLVNHIRDGKSLREVWIPKKHNIDIEIKDGVLKMTSRVNVIVIPKILATASVIKELLSEYIKSKQN